jgi:hypothetical protein
VDRDAGEEPVAATVVEVEVRVDDDRDATHEVVRERVRVPLAAVLLDRRCRVDQPRVDEDEAVGMLDRFREPEQPAAGEDDFARLVPTDVVAADHGFDSFLGDLSAARSC